MNWKQVVSTLVSIYFGNPRLDDTIKTNYWKIQTADLEIYSILIFNKRSVTISLPHFVYGFSRKIFPMICSINWRHFIAWLPLVSELSDNTVIIWMSAGVLIYFSILFQKRRSFKGGAHLNGGTHKKNAK